MERQTHKSEGKLKTIVGIGGIYCPCCTHGPKNVTKRLWNRTLRRIQAIALRNELQEYLTWN